MKKSVLVGMIGLIVCVNFLFVTGCTKDQVVKKDVDVMEEKASAQAQNTAMGQTENSVETMGEQAASSEEASPVMSEQEKPLTDLASNEQAASVPAAEKAIKGEAPAIKGEQTLANINFDFDSYTLKPEVREILKGHAAVLADKKNYQLVIEGHCDERGTTEYNLALGERRAAEAQKYLSGIGIDEKFIKTISYGKEMPLDPGHTEEAWAKNRRDNFIITPQK